MRKIIKENMGWVITIVSFIIVIVTNIITLSYYFGKIDERMQNISEQNRNISTKIDMKMSIDTHNIIEENNKKDHEFIRLDIANLANTIKIYNDNLMKKIDEQNKQIDIIDKDVAILKSNQNKSN